MACSYYLFLVTSRHFEYEYAYDGTSDGFCCGYDHDCMIMAMAVIVRGILALGMIMTMTLNASFCCYTVCVS